MGLKVVEIGPVMSTVTVQQYEKHSLDETQRRPTGCSNGRLNMLRPTMLNDAAPTCTVLIRSIGLSWSLLHDCQLRREM